MNIWICIDAVSNFLACVATQVGVDSSGIPYYNISPTGTNEWLSVDDNGKIIQVPNTSSQGPNVQWVLRGEIALITPKWPTLVPQYGFVFTS